MTRAPTHVGQPSRAWMQSLPPALCASFCCSCIAIIPTALSVAGTFLVLIGAIGLAGLLSARIVEQQRWRAIRVWPVVILLGAYLASMAAHGFPESSVRRSASMPMYAMLFLAIQVCAWQPLWMRLVLGSAGILAVAMSFDVSWQWLTGYSFIRGAAHQGPSDYPGSLGNRNDFAAAALFLPLSYGAWPATVCNRVHFLCVALSAPTWILSRSRQTAIGWLFAATVPLIRGSRPWGTLLSVCVTIAGAATVALAVPALRDRVLETIERGLGEREAIVALGLHLCADHPWFGVGPGMFGEHYALAVETGWTWRGQVLPPVGMPWVHSIPVEVAAEFGVFGLAAFGVAVVFAWRQANRLARRTGPLESVGRGVAAALIAGLVVGMIDLSLIKDWFRCWFWLVLGLSCLACKDPARTGCG